jgi:hypothetical protein
MALMQKTIRVNYFEHLTLNLPEEIPNLPAGLRAVGMQAGSKFQFKYGCLVWFRKS